MLTEFEKKQSGQVYDARDLRLREMQNRAKDLMREYNNIPAGDTGERSRVLELMIGSLGKNARINQPFYIDYGKNITIGDNSFINLNCTLLDTGTITIGKNTLIGPDVRIYTAVHEKDGYDRFWAEPDGTMAVKTWAEPLPAAILVQSRQFWKKGKNFRMKTSLKIKIFIDILMTFLLLLLMGYQFWGDSAHEWAGAAMFALFLVHHILNRNWSMNLFKGKYSPRRGLQLLVNLALTAVMAGMMVSGVMLSRHVFAFLPHCKSDRIT